MLWRSHLLGVPSYWAFPWPGGGARPWPSGAWDQESGAGPGPGPDPDLGGRVPRHFLRPQRHLAMAWRRRQAMGTPSNWERPVTGNAITLDFRKRRGGVGWGVNFGLVGSSFRVSYPTVLDPIKIFVFSNPSRGVCVCGLCQFSPNLCTIIAPW